MVATPESPHEGDKLESHEGKNLRPEGQKGRHLCADSFGWSRQENSCSFCRSRRAPTQEPFKAKPSGERRRCFFLGGSCPCAVAFLLVLLSGSRVVRAVFVRRLPRLLPCRLFFRGASFLVGAVPKTGNDFLGIPARRRRLRHCLLLRPTVYYEPS